MQQQQQQQQQRQQSHSCYQQSQPNNQQQQPQHNMYQVDTGSGGGGIIGGGKKHSNKKSSNNNNHHHHNHHQHHHHHQIENSQNNNNNTDNYYYSKSVESIGGSAGGVLNNNNNNGCCSTNTTYGQESWGRDSGARDLSPEPQQHRILLPPSAAISNGTADSQLTDHPDNDGDDDHHNHHHHHQQSSMIHLATKLQVAALSALKTEVIDVAAKLQHSECERDIMARQLKEALDERDRAKRRLEAIGTAHESRITEMHCVIVELSKKLKNQKDTAIVEENDIDGSVSELSFQEGSVYNSEMECTNIIENESQTGPPPFDMRFGVLAIEQQQEQGEEEEKQHHHHQLLDSPCSLPPPVTSNQLQLQAMHEEIFHLRSQVAYLQSQLPPPPVVPSPPPPPLSQSISDEIIDQPKDFIVKNKKSNQHQMNSMTTQTTTTQTTTTNIIQDNEDELCHNFGNVLRTAIDRSIAKRKKIYQMATVLSVRGTGVGGGDVSTHSSNKSAYNNQNNQLYMGNNSNNNNNNNNSHQPPMIVSKMAERVKLRRTIEEENHITGPEIMNCGIYTTEIAEHLVSDLLQNEMIDDCTNGDGDDDDGDDGNDRIANGGGRQSSRRLILHTEIQRLHRRIDHLRIQNSVLQITLQESKAHCDHLYLLCGKYESNAIALHQALNYSDRAIEAYDVMLALLESRLNIVENEDNESRKSSPSAVTTAEAIATTNAKTITTTTVITAEAKAASDSRRAAEAVARHLMDRLESEINNGHCNPCSLGPWQDAVVVIYANNKNNLDPWTSTDDLRLRGHVSQLKGLRAAVQNTVVILESPFVDNRHDVVDDDPYHYGKCTRINNKSSSSPNDIKQYDNIRRMDLETAVLMQELMSMREDVSESKFRTEQAEREKNSAVERLSVLQEAISHLQAQLADAENLLAVSNKTRLSSTYSESEHVAGIERELVEALARESRLKARLQGLMGSLETAAKSSEEKYAQVQNTVSELKQANVTLTQSLDRCKRKYQTRLRRLEEQLLDLSLGTTTGTKKIGNCSPQTNINSPLKNVPETTL